jgi:hypothetical protein
MQIENKTIVGSNDIFRGAGEREITVYATVRFGGKDVLVFADNARDAHAFNTIFSPLIATSAEKNTEFIKAWVSALQEIVPELRVKYKPIAKQLSVKISNIRYTFPASEYEAFATALSFAFSLLAHKSSSIKQEYKTDLKEITKSYVQQFKN